jgi:hypothetical protein
MIEDILDQATLILLAPTAIALAAGALVGKRREGLGFVVLMEIFVVGWFTSDLLWNSVSWQLHDAVSFAYLVVLVAVVALIFRRWRWAVRKAAEIEKFVEPNEAPEAT